MIFATDVDSCRMREQNEPSQRTPKGGGDGSSLTRRKAYGCSENRSGHYDALSLNSAIPSNLLFPRTQKNSFVGKTNELIS